MEGEDGRVRGWRQKRLKKNRVPFASHEFVNPFPYMSSVEARVWLFLNEIHVPFMWRYFDGVAPNFTSLVPGFTPEFTLSEYKIVILILGTYYGTLPGVLDKNALAQATLEYDGWTVAVLWEADIVRDTRRTVLDALPALNSPTVQGAPKANPFGIIPDYVSKRKERLSGIQLKRKKFFDPERKQGINDRNPNHRVPSRHRGRRARAVDSPR